MLPGDGPQMYSQALQPGRVGAAVAHEDVAMPRSHGHSRCLFVIANIVKIANIANIRSAWDIFETFCWFAAAE